MRPRSCIGSPATCLACMSEALCLISRSLTSIRNPCGQCAVLSHLAATAFCSRRRSRVSVACGSCRCGRSVSQLCRCVPATTAASDGGGGGFSFEVDMAAGLGERFVLTATGPPVRWGGGLTTCSGLVAEQLLAGRMCPCRQGQWLTLAVTRWRLAPAPRPGSRVHGGRRSVAGVRRAKPGGS